MLNMLVILFLRSQIGAIPLHSPGPADEPTQVLTLSLPDSP